MKTVTGRVMSAEPISLSKAATLLSGFSCSETGTSQDVSAYLRRASAAFNELKSIHRDIKSKGTKKRKRDGEIGSEERKSKKKRKSNNIDV